MPAQYSGNSVTKVARAKAGGGFESAIPAGPVAGFTAETGFSLLDNGDGTLSITDSQSRFGTKPNAAKPVWFFDFGAGSDQPHPTLSRQQKVIAWAAQCVPNQVVAKAGATHSMTIDTAQADGSNDVFTGEGGKTLSLPTNPGGKFFRYYDVYNDFTATSLADNIVANTPASGPNFKTHRWQSDGAQATPYTVVTLQGWEYDLGFSGDGIASGLFYDSRGQLSAKGWNTEEEYHRVSSAAAATDAFCAGAINGERKFTLSAFDSHAGTDPQGANRWNHYKLGNFRFWATPGACPWRANLLYVDDSWCRVYITDKPTWSNIETKTMEIQVPVGWVAGQVDFHHRLGALGSLTGKYLWVTDNDDVKILIGSWS